MTKQQYILAGLVTVGFFAVFILLIFAPEGAIPERFDKPFNLLIGGLLTNFGIIVNYFFGSSKSSADKNTIVNRAMKMIDK